MPLHLPAFTSVNRLALQPDPSPGIDWGFDLLSPWDRLSVFTRHIDTGGAVTRVPVFALAELRLSDASSAAVQDPELEARIPFPKVPLGVVGTDHVGYGSFDLWPLRSVAMFESVRNALAAVGLLAPGLPRLTVVLGRLVVLPFKDPDYPFDALKEGDVGPGFLCLRMDLDALMLARRAAWPQMPAMQTPGIDDWRLSPGSFSMAGALLIGEDGCETLLPANLATRLVRFRQLVRTPPFARFSPPPTQPALEPRRTNFSGHVRLGYSVEFRSEWFPIGHSLGQIAYSLPLAPGEKMKIAVVDWTRRDAAKRTERSTEKEDLQHAALRDRTLTEAVEMVVRESQAGSSFMAGKSHSAGAGIPIGPVSLGVGSASGLGGASTDSEGMRSIVGETTQRISDAFHQASSAQRELNSTIVVQADQAEAAQARTRVVANYNHSHALTVLYYEVLQHHRVLTKPAGVRPALFLKHETKPFVLKDDNDAPERPDYELIQRHRSAIAASLLDESLRGCLDAVQKLLCNRRTFRQPPTYLPTDDFILNEFLLKVKTGASAAKRDVAARLLLKDGDPVDCLLLREGAGPLDPPKLDPLLNRLGAPHRVAANSERWFRLVLQKPVRWGNASKIELRQGSLGATWEGVGEDPWDIEWVHACANAEPLYWVMANGPPPFSPLPHEGTMQIPVQRYVPGPGSPEEMLTDEERCCLGRLVDHLNEHLGHYWRAIWTAETPADRAVRLDGWKIGQVPLLDVVENTVLDVDGEYVVMPVAAGAAEILDPEFNTERLGMAKTPYLEYVEQLVTMPARGVFAEAKLGHCNASERIDPSRFWDWQTSPIPDDAPDIKPPSTDSKYEDPKGLTPTAFPSPMVNIVNPQGLPDPAGLGAAAGVLSSLGPFRDMSGIKELGAYLQTLSNNATQLASQGLKNAQTAGLLNTIRSAKELPAETRDRLIGELLTGQVRNQQPPPQQPPPPQPPQPPPPPPPPPPQPQPPPPVPKRATATSGQTRKLRFTFKYDTEHEMWGYYQVRIFDGQTDKEWNPRGNVVYTNVLDVAIPSSVKTGVTIQINGPVSPNHILAPADVAPQPWSHEIQVTEQFASLEGVTGFRVIGQTKEVNLEVTIETEGQDSKVKTNSHEFGVTLKGEKDFKVVEVSGEAAYKYTKTFEETHMDGNKKVETKKLAVRMLDKQKQPKIEPVK